MTDRSALVLMWVVSALFAMALFRVETGLGLDSTQTVGWVTSLAWDHDLDLSNDQFHASSDPENILPWQRHRIGGGGPPITATGHWANTAPIGPAVVWGVGLAPVMITEVVLKGTDDFARSDRFAFRYRFIVSLVSLAMGLHALFLIYHTARRFYPPGVSAMAAIVAIFGSMATHFILIEGAMSHAASLWAASLLWALTTDRWATRPAHWTGKDLAMGMGLGLLVMIRPGAIVWALLPACVLLSQMVPRHTRRAAVLGALLAAFGSLIVFSIQMIAWHAVFGRWLALPQGGGSLLSSGRSPALWQTLFGQFNSLFPCHPWTLAAFAGILLWGWKRPCIAVPGLAALMLTWLLNSLVAEGFAETSFGARRWSHTMPLFALGWAALMNLIPPRWPRRALGFALTSALLLWNVVMMTQHAREVLTPAWWSQRDIWPALFGAAIDRPFDWMIGSLADFLSMGKLHLSLALTVLLGLGLIFTAIAILTWAGSRPWPRGRWGRAVLALAVLHVIICIGLCLTARIDSSDRESNLHLRSLLTAVATESQWTTPQRGEFTPQRPLDHVVAAGQALDRGQQATAIAHLASAETAFPRFVHVLTLQRAASPEPRRRAALHLWANLRLLDHHANEMLFEHHARHGETSLLQQMVTRIPMTRDQRGDLMLRLANLRSDDSAIRHALRERLRTHPSEADLRMQLAHIEAARDRESRAERLHGEARAWAESSLKGHEAIAAAHPEESAAHFSGAIYHSAHTLLETMDVGHETERALALLDRHEAIQPDPTLVASLSMEMQRRLREAAPITLGLPQDEALVAAVEKWSATNLDDPLAYESVTEVLGARGRWEEAMEMLAVGLDRVPDQIDVPILAYTAAGSLSEEVIRSASIESLSDGARPVAAIGLSLRALGLGDETLAERWASRARMEGLPPALAETLRTRVWSLYGDQP